MKSVFIEYSNAVLHDYETKKKSNQLSIRLSIPKPANLKKECSLVFSRRYLTKDTKTLYDFFEKNIDQDSFPRMLSKFDNDKFKPLQRFLNKETQSTSEKNIELLAWLIDFQPRPFNNENIYLVPKSPESPESPEDLVKGMTPNTSSGSDENAKPTYISTSPTGDSLDQKPSKKLKKYGILVSLVIVFATIILYWNIKEKDVSGLMSIGLPAFGSCMYWAGDQYEPISCSEKKGDTMIIALDKVKLANLRKITQPDTISLKSIGRAWYVKINGEMEYYTSGGFHPVRTELRLKPITNYIIDKYIYGKDSNMN